MLSLVLVARRPRACARVSCVRRPRERESPPRAARPCVCAVSQAVSLTRVGLDVGATAHTLRSVLGVDDCASAVTVSRRSTPRSAASAWELQQCSQLRRFFRNIFRRAQSRIRHKLQELPKDRKNARISREQLKQRSSGSERALSTELRSRLRGRVPHNHNYAPPPRRAPDPRSAGLWAGSTAARAPHLSSQPTLRLSPVDTWQPSSRVRTQSSHMASSLLELPREPGDGLVAFPLR